MSGAWSLRRWTWVVSAVVVAVLVGTIASVSIAIGDLNEARTRLLDVVGPAVVGSQQLATALVDQETGVRGFASTGEAEFLQPYEDGTRRQEQAHRDIEAAVAALPEVSGEVAAVDSAIAAWRAEYADPVITAVRAGAAPPSIESGKQRFDAVRTALSDLASRIGAVRNGSRTALNEASSRLVATCVVAMAVLLVAIGAAVVVMHRFVLRPLSVLRVQVGEVAAGRFEHAVTASGPVELAELGRDVDSMRRRIVAELAEARERNTVLDTTAADLRRSNSELEQFAYVASHDLQEPLRKVASFCQLLQARYAERLDGRANQYIDFAVDGAKRMQVLINDLLRFSRVGRHSDDHRDVRAADLVRAAVENLDDLVRESGARMEVGELPVVHGDPTLLAAVFQNLVGNGVKFRSAAAPVVSVTARPIDDRWEFVVADNGIGIDAQYAERIFVIFQRLHDKTSYPGTGIGLALCRKIVEFHGGRIWLDTTAEQGTTIRFTLPGAPVPAEPETARQSPSPDAVDHRESQVTQ
ncbi:ATP-binding protein [Actinosynnema sp. NPDC020468]|uniref:sensor histidine kinase n=1 Tax=Actinosynnema sp. NPDC020468 TaxID=3154488 RepID=UPI0033ED9A4E